MGVAAMRDARPLPKRRRLNPSNSSTQAIALTEPSAAKAAQKSAAACNAPTCTVCSRTCTAASSFPPPSSTANLASAPTHSPRRPALALNAPNTNVSATNALGTNTPVKRKKPRDAEDSDRDAERDDSDGCGLGLPTGCGRTLCRECCFESAQERLTPGE
ncbi:hypothetical protein B0H19DRAFT_1058247 [Mycena capillaripes]|nr:hypothetical protein B0H19DRAFT_1058247 [Mycena capillaripes]